MARTPSILAALLSDPAYAPDAIARIVAAYRDGGWSTRGAATALGLAESTLYDWRARYPDLESAIKSGQKSAGFKRSGRRPGKRSEIDG